MKKILSIILFTALAGHFVFAQMPGVDIRSADGGTTVRRSSDNMVSNFDPTLAVSGALKINDLCFDRRRGALYRWNGVSWQIFFGRDDGQQADIAYTVTNPASNIATGWDPQLYNKMTINYTTAGPDTMYIDTLIFTGAITPGEIYVVDMNNSRTVDADTLLLHFNSMWKTYDGQPLTEWKCPPRGRIQMAFRVHISVEGATLVEVDDILGSWQHGSGGGGGGAQVFTQVQAAHGFTAGQLIYFHNAATAELAKSDVGLADSVAQWAVKEVINDSTFTYCNTCEVPLTTGYTVGSYLWLSPTLGAVTNVQPTSTNCQYVGVVRTDSTIWAHIGDLCGGGGGGGGITSLNGLTSDTQLFAVGTAGSDFNISSVDPTHTFNLPTASATKRGALSSADWSLFNSKFSLPALTAGSVLFSNGTTIAQDNANLFWDDVNKRLGIGTTSPVAKLSVRRDNIGVTQDNSYGIILNNTTAASSGNQQMSPPIVWRGQGWKTTATAASQSVDFRVDILPVQGTTAPTGIWNLKSSINGGAFTDIMTVSSSGSIIHTQTGATETIGTFGNSSAGKLYLGVGNGNQFAVGYPFAVFSADGSFASRPAVVSSGTTGLSISNVALLAFNPGLTTTQSLVHASYGTNKPSDVFKFMNSGPNSGTAYTYTSGNLNFITVPGSIATEGFAPTSGSGKYVILNINPTINQTGGANGITRGIYIAPTLTAAADWRAIETTAGSFKMADTYLAGSGSLAGSLIDLTQTWNTTGTPTAFKLNVTDAASNSASLLMDLQVGGTSRFEVNKGGDITAFRDITSGRDLNASNIGTISWNGRSTMASPSNGQIKLADSSGIDFSRLQFGGTTSSYPSLKRNTTYFDARLADDSAYTYITDLYNRIGSGSPEGVVTAPVGAVYHRTDGGASTSIYVKESGTGNTGWVAK